MNSLLFLSEEDFTLSNTAKGLILKTRIKGFSLVMFYSTQCEHCDKLIPIFKNLPNIIGGCHFAIVNISTNMGIIENSEKTISPITYVPDIILHIDGKPFVRYMGPHTIDEIQKFVIEISKKVLNKQTFTTTSDDKISTENKNLPEYTIGRPLFGDESRKICYLDFKKAYKDKDKK